MAQILKDQVKQKIETAALEIFSSEGFENATMASIAKKAGISVGNIYNYYESKDDLFYFLITPSFVSKFKKLLQARMKTARGIKIEDFSQNEDLKRINKERLEFFFQHRIELIILLQKSKGTIYEGFTNEMRDMFVGGVTEYFEELYQYYKKDIDHLQRFLLKLMYDNYFVSLSHILEKFDTKDDLEKAFMTYLEIHLSGLLRL